MDIPVVAPIKPTPNVAPVDTSAPPPQPKRKTTYRVLGFFAGAAIAGCVIAIATHEPVLTPMRLAWSALTIPSELAHAHFLQAHGGSAVFVRDGLGFSTVARGALDADWNRTALVTLAHREDGAYVVREGDAMIFESETMLKDLTISPNGFQVAGARLVEGTGTLEVPDAWRVFALDRYEGVERDLGPGFAPVFLDDRTLLYFTEAGIMLMDPVSGEVIGSAEGSFLDPYLTSRISPDRSLIAWRHPGNREILVFRVRQTNPFAYELVTIIPADGGDFALGNEMVYVSSADGTHLSSYGFDGGEARQVHAFPAEIGISRPLLAP